MVFKTADSTENGRNDFSTYMRTQSARVKGRACVLNAALKAETVIKQLPLVAEQTDPVAWLDEEVKVEYTDNSEILTVSLAGPEPQSVVAVVNAITQAYLQEIENQERKSRSRRVAELDNIYVAAKEKLRVKRETLRRRADELGTSDSQAMTQRQLLQLSSLGDIRKQYGQVRFELLQTRARMAAHEQRIKNPPSAAVSGQRHRGAADDLDEVARVHRIRVEQAASRYPRLRAACPRIRTRPRWSGRLHAPRGGEEGNRQTPRRHRGSTPATEQQRKQEVTEVKANVEGLQGHRGHAPATGEVAARDGDGAVSTAMPRRLAARPRRWNCSAA